MKDNEMTRGVASSTLSSSANTLYIPREEKEEEEGHFHIKDGGEG